MSTCSGSFLYDAHQAGAASHRVKTAWQPHPLVEPATECQAFKIAWPLHFFQVLVEITTESQALQTAWQCHSVQTLVEPLTETKALQTAWSTQSPYFKLCRLLGKVTTCRLSLSSGWKVKLCRHRQPSNPNSRSADCLVKPFGLNHGQGNQTSGFANCSAKTFLPSYGETQKPKCNSCRLPGKVILSMLWLKLSPKIKAFKPLGKVTLPKL